MKSLFLTFFSLCFLCTGIVTLFMEEENIASAQTVVVDGIKNNIPDYLSVQEIGTNGEVVNNSFIDDSTFLYTVDATGTSNSLSIKLKTNGLTVNPGAEDIYQYVYYPNADDTSTFYFYTIQHTDIYINGIPLTISEAEKNFNIPNEQELSFENHTKGTILEEYELNFSKNNTTDPHTISLLDEDGNLIEGRYTVEIALTLYTCTGGRTDGLEESTSFTDYGVNLKYEFLVLNRSEYITNYRPVVTADSFDSSYQVTSTQSSVYGYYYYFNYSYINNQIANITYDPTKYDLSITKSLNSEEKSVKFEYIEENVTENNDGLSITGDDIVNYVKNKETNNVTIYFKDVGNYSLSFNAVATFKYTQNNVTVNNKYQLKELSNQLKHIMVYGYGYQATYVDYDNGAVYTEFKSYENESGEFDGKFYESADITSQFLASNSSYGQNTSTTDTRGNTTFTINNVLGYINRNKPAVASTNQQPIRFVSNATIATGNISSYVYSTAENNYSATDLTFNGQTLYSAKYTGGSISEPGTYIFILAYNFNNFHTTSGQLAQGIYFYQVFYFDITSEAPILEIFESGDDGKEISSDDFTNKDVVIRNKNIDEIHNKSVTVQIYAYDYNTDSYLSEFGGENGINMLDLKEYTGGNSVILTKNATYTIHLYYTNEMSTISTNINDKTNQKNIKRRYEFTIDKQQIDGITGRNVSLMSGTTTYSILDEIQGLSTNQDFIVSWNKKASGAPTYAYYRYFPIVESDYYGTSTEEEISELLFQFIEMRGESSYIPIDFSLDLSDEENNWLPYNNTYDSTVSINHDVKTEQGLYIFDIYDEAGNHSYQIYIKDTTSPSFVLQTGAVYSIVPTSYFISETSTLHWGDYKALQINTGTQNWNFNLSADELENLDASAYNFSLFKNSSGVCTKEIFLTFYNSLYRQNNLQYIASPSESTGVYLTIEIEDITWQTDLESENDSYKMVEGKSVELSADTDKGYTYRVLIRDKSNNKYTIGTDSSNEEQKYNFNQYASYYSARQTIIVSFDDSEFHLYYENSKGEEETLSSNNTLDGTVSVGEEEYSTLTTYLSPINLEKTIYLSFIATKTDESTSQTVQVESVTMEHYQYEDKTYEHEDGTISHFYSISTQATKNTLYTYSDGQDQNEKVIELNITGENITAAGKYVITRTYRIGDGFTMNAKDDYSLTYVLYIDRNEIISSATPVTDKNGTHNESLMGGEIFVSMYDIGERADIVVTFPTNSIVGSNDGETTLYNGSVSKPAWVTNKLPVSVYIPTYKYTMYAERIIDNAETGEYHYQDSSSDLDNYYYKDSDKEKVINEYLLYAEIYKNYQSATDDPIAKTTTTWDSPNPSNAESVNGFLNFYDKNGNILKDLTEEGLYTVMIYQGYNSVGAEGETFRQSIAFSFEIESVKPNFTARTQASTLKSDTVSAGGKTIERYHTNEDTIQIIWDKPEDTEIFKAEIDTDNITIQLTANNTTYSAQKVSAQTLFNGNIEESTGTYIGTLTFSNISNEIFSGNFYRNGNYIDITMQFENHNNSYYETVTKRIYIDTQAPYINIENLVNNVIENSYSPNLISYDDLRTRTNGLNVNTNANNETVYNISTDSGVFRYFSYSVAENYLNTLKSTSKTEASDIYYREFNNKYTTARQFETSPDAFLETSFNKIDSLSAFVPGNYYEIVESDLAGNLTIYTIYITNYATDDTSLVTYEVEEDGETLEKQLTSKDYNDALALTNHTATLNIFGKPGLKITGVNYFGNAWINFVVTRRSDTGLETYVNYYTSPWLYNKVYRIEGNQFVEVDLETIINSNLNSRYKNQISFFDQVLGTTTNIYVNTRNTTLSSSLTSDQEREYITFEQPTNAEIENTKQAFPYLQKLKIYTPGSDADGTVEIVYFEQENKFGYSDLWTSNQNVTVSSSGRNLTFELNSNLNLVDNTRIVYEFVDNYGEKYTEIHLYHETTNYREISSGNTLYSFYYNDNNLYYITENDFRYTYNEAKYSVKIYQYENGWVELTTQNALVNVESRLSNTIRTLSFNSFDDETYYSHRLMIEVNDTAREEDDGPVKTIYFILNNEVSLPETNSMDNIVNEFYFTSNGRMITASLLGINEDQVDYFSKVTLNYRSNATFLPIKFELSTDGVIWTEVESGTEISCPDDIEQQDYYLRVWYDMDTIEDLGYLDQTGNYTYIFEYVPASNVYHFKLSSTLSTAYYITVARGDSVDIVEKSGQTYYTPGLTNIQSFANHYIVNINYQDRDSLLEIVTNAEQLIESTEITYYQDADNVRTYIYNISNLINIANIDNIPRFDTDIAITFIEPTDQFTSEFYTFNSAGIIDRNNNLVTTSTLDYIVPDTSSISQIKLQWSKYYAIQQNVINIKITKNGYELNPVLYTEIVGGKEYYYTYITRSGRYKISFIDASGNVQIFNKGNTSQTDDFTLVFLKDIPYTVTYTNPMTNEEETTEPISQAIYNGSVILMLDKELNSYYRGNIVNISVTRNGSAYTGYSHSNGTYTFNQTGYYGVTFTAQSSKDTSENYIRSQTYFFTIINPNEYRYSFIINKYSNYYIESIYKDGVDMTNIYLKSLNLDTIMVNQKEYLSELALYYLDEKTSSGTYIITVNSNEKLYNSESTKTSWTFQVKIKVGKENLIYTSINAGESTTSPIVVQFNAGNVYEEYGESTLRVIYYQDDEAYVEYSYAINANSTGLQSHTIERTNSYFVQIVTSNGDLRYSIKVTKNEPFNAATIIAIVVSAIVLLVVIILIIVLRKRISVK